ncbi:hypothetical protein GCM10011349_24080 [Novosphingobium indicum]|uniref:Uncharacterized protein n=1 Tax=Novosphingobium indicum TaxID=462949 RepID=A0ABQ2JRE3_9SPHN|nr:hypothetical protein [Novosphingobium indicum]GGN51488.1 hypothetical protein GCM10011349_24080 [Novosphingobium indicum]
MSASVPRLFADIKAMLEDMHAVAVEGQCCDNSPDMQLALTRLLRSRTATVEASLVIIAHRLGGEHD